MFLSTAGSTRLIGSKLSRALGLAARLLPPPRPDQGSAGALGPPLRALAVMGGVTAAAAPEPDPDPTPPPAGRLPDRPLRASRLPPPAQNAAGTLQSTTKPVSARAQAKRKMQDISLLTNSPVLARVRRGCGDKKAESQHTGRHLGRAGAQAEEELKTTYRRTCRSPCGRRAASRRCRG